MTMEEILQRDLVGSIILMKFKVIIHRNRENYMNGQNRHVINKSMYKIKGSDDF